MKRLRLVLLLVLAFALSGVAQAEEKYNPGLNHSGTIGDTNRNWRLGGFDKFQMPEITAPTGNPDANFGWLYVKDSGGESALYFESDAGTVTQIGNTATKWDDIGDPDASGTVAFTTFQQIITSTKTDGDGLNIQGLGAFGDVSVVRIEQKTGNPTDGTVLEVVAADANVDPLVVSSSGKVNALVVGQNTGVVTVAGVAVGTDTLILTAGDALLTDGNAKLTTGYLSFGADPADAGTIRLSNAGSIQFEASAAGVDVNALSVDASEIVQIGSAGASGVTVTPDTTFTGNIQAVDGTFTGNVNVTGTFQQDAITAVTAATTLTVDGTGVGGVTVGGTSTGAVTLGGGATLVNLPSTVDLTLSGGDLTVTDTANADMVTFTNNTMTTADLVVLSASGTRTSDNVIEITDGATTGTTIGVTANAMTSGDGVSYTNSGAALTGSAYAAYVTDGAGFTGYYFRGYDGAADDFSVKRYGATTIAGNAATNVLTVTAGDVQIDAGRVEIDNTGDVVNRIARNNATGTGAVLEIEQTHTGGGIALLIDQKNTTAGEYAIDIASGGATQIHFTANGAAGSGMLYDATNAWTGQALVIDAGPWLGTLNRGVIDFRSDNAATAEVGSVVYVKMQGSAADAAAIDGKGLYIEDEAAATAGSYLVKLDTLANTALHISNSGAAADGIKIDVADSYTGQGFVADLGPWLGTSGEGFIEINSDNAATVPAGQFMRFRQLGTGQHAAAIGGTLVYLEDDATAPAAGTSYVMNIDATNIEAIHVDTGKVLVDETVTATGGVSSGTASDSFIYTDTVECNNACIKGLRAAPLALVAGPGAANFIEVVSAVLVLDYGSEVLTVNADDNLVIEYGDGGDDITAAIETDGFMTAAADTMKLVLPAGIATVAAVNLLNSNVRLFNVGAAEIAGNATNDTTLTIKINYRIHAAGL
jgi:hypothetical protein